jgi:tetratricopeptide (TPR) repeat protein
MWKKLFGPQSPEEYQARVVKALDAGNAARALQLSAEALQRFPKTIEAHLLHSQVLALSGQTDAAAQVMDGIADKYPTSSWLQKARVFSRARDLPRAIDCFGRAASADPEHADAWLGWGTALADSGNHQLALEKFEKAAALDPNESIIPFNRGNSLSTLRRLDDALASYKKAQALGNENALGGIRSTLLKLGRVAEANAVPGSQTDPQGEARERRKELASGAIVARYFVGRHTNPELLDAVVQRMVENAAGFEHEPPGLRNGVTIQYGWPQLTVREQGGLRVLCEPDWQLEEATNHVEHVSFSAMQLVQMQLMLSLTSAQPQACSCRQTIFIE